MSTFFALTRLPKEQLKGTSNPRKQWESAKEDRLAKLKCSEPLWKTEHEVRVALLDGSIAAANTTFDRAWADMLAWVKYQKALEQTGFRKSKAKVNPKRYTHVFSFGG